MFGSHPSRWIIFLVSGSLTALGCVGTTDTGPQSETGSLSVELVLADGLEIDEVGWQITGNGMDMSGDVDVSAPGSTASVEVFGLPPGETDYTVTLTATSIDEEVSCQGSAPFNVEVGQSTDVMVMLNCKKPRTLGGVRVNGKFNICTQLTKVVVSPLQTSVGNDISLSAQAFDEEGDAITYSWTGDGGSIADPTAASTTYTCQDVGEHTVTIMVTDNDVYCRMATWTVPVTCVEGDGGDLCENVVCEDDGNECTATECNPANGACETSNVADGTECNGGAGACSAGVCVDDNLCEGIDCNDDLECTADACNPADGSCDNVNVDNGTPCADDAGMCVDGSCIVDNTCDGVICDDTGNDCTVAMCNTATGMCETMNVTDGTECNGGAGACSAGVCVDASLCVGVDCTSDNDCVQDGTCDPATGNCIAGDDEPIDTACTADGGTVCDGNGACVECNDGTQCPDDSNQCTTAACDTNLCGQSNVMNGMACDFVGMGDGMCTDGTCVAAPTCTPATADVDCDDGDDCTINSCPDGMCVSQPEEDGVDCDASGTPGTCQSGVCIETICAIDGDCDDANQCTDDTCDTSVAGGACVNANNDANACDTCTSGTCECSGGSCDDVAAASANVCAQFSPVPVSTTQTCDGSAGQECICEKAEFIAIDCELVGNSAPLPLAASAQQFGVAFAGTPVTILPRDAIVIPPTLVCGFIGAGFADALVADSDILATYTNADLASSALKSFLATASSGGDLVSPHGEVFFDFGVACGDNCTGPLGSETCASSGDPCTPTGFTDDCSVENGGTVGTGPGIVAPFFANAPGSIPPGPIPGNQVSLTPTAAGSVDIGLPYSGIALNLPDVGGLVSGCIGGACTAAPICTPTLRGTEVSPRVMYDALCTKPGFGACGGTECDTTADCPLNSAAIGGTLPGQTCDAGLCTDVNSGTCGLGGPGLCPDTSTSCGSCEDADGNTGICSISGFVCAIDIECPFGTGDLCGPATACAVDGDCAAAETCALSDDRCNPVIDAISGGAIPTCCSPFGDFTTTADVCKGGLQLEDLASAPPCCDQKLPGVGSGSDLFCTSAPNNASCCAAIATDYPPATPAQLPQLWVNP